MKRFAAVLVLCAGCGAASLPSTPSASSTPPEYDGPPEQLVLGAPRSFEFSTESIDAWCDDATTDLGGNVVAGLEHVGTPRRERYWWIQPDGGWGNELDAMDGFVEPRPDGFIAISAMVVGVYARFANGAGDVEPQAFDDLPDDFVASASLGETSALLLQRRGGSAHLVTFDGQASPAIDRSFDGETALAMAATENRLLVVNARADGTVHARWLDADGSERSDFALPMSAAGVALQPMIGGVLVGPRSQSWTFFLREDATAPEAVPAGWAALGSAGARIVGGGTAYAVLPSGAFGEFADTTTSRSAEVDVHDARGTLRQVIPIPADDTMPFAGAVIGRDGTLMVLRIGASGMDALCHWDTWPALLK